MSTSQAKVVGEFARAFRNFTAQKWSAIGLHPGQGAILHELGGHSGVSQSDLANAVGVTQPTMAKGLSRMGKAGVVERRSDPVDGRASLNSLTIKGHALLRAYEASWDEINAEMFDGMTDEEIRAGLTFVRRLQENISTQE